MPKHHRSKALPHAGKAEKIQSVRQRNKRPNTQSPAERKLWKEIRGTLARKRRSARIKGRETPAVPILYSPSGDGLKRGPKKDLTRDDADKCTEILSGAFTPNEVAVMEKFRTSFPFPPTRSQFVRFLATQFMRKGKAFSLDGGLNPVTRLPIVLEAMEADTDVQLFLRSGSRV